MTSKGQITVPSETRAKLRPGPGSKVDFVETRPGKSSFGLCAAISGGFAAG
jgi:AbrB family looped-hinge helix DNA binding protein